MDEHPLVRFADGPAGRRARLTGTGKDVWEVAAGAARYLEIPLGLVQAAIAYYGACTAEIDQQIDANERETAELHSGRPGRLARSPPGTCRGCPCPPSRSGAPRR